MVVRVAVLYRCVLMRYCGVFVLAMLVWVVIYAGVCCWDIAVCVGGRW